MPEGPEIARYAANMRTTLLREGASQPRLVNFIRLGNMFTNVNVEDMRSCLDQPLLDVAAKGKQLYLIFQDSRLNQAGQPEIKVINGHLGMKGRWLVEKFDPQATPNMAKYKNVHFRIDLSYTPGSYQPEIVIFYENQRFGRIDILNNRLEFERAIAYLAPGFLGLDQLTPEKWMQRWRVLGKTRYLRDVLMDQTNICCGVGNYIIIELLYEIKCHPKVKIGHFTEENALALYHVLKKLLQDFFSGAREKVVYKKETSPCGNRIFYEKMFTRPMYWVPAVQTYGAPLNDIPR